MSCKWFYGAVRFSRLLYSCEEVKLLTVGKYCAEKLVYIEKVPVWRVITLVEVISYFTADTRVIWRQNSSLVVESYFKFNIKMCHFSYLLKWNIRSKITELHCCPSARLYRGRNYNRPGQDRADYPWLLFNWLFNFFFSEKTVFFFKYF